jgi:hypothetical protein
MCLPEALSSGSVFIFYDYLGLTFGSRGYKDLRRREI